MSEQQNLYSRSEMQKSMHRDRGDIDAGAILHSKKFQVKELAKKGYSVSLIARLLHLNYNTTVRYLIEK